MDEQSRMNLSRQNDLCTLPNTKLCWQVQIISYHIIYYPFKVQIFIIDMKSKQNLKYLF